MSSYFKERFMRMLHPYVMVFRHGCKRPQDPFDFSLALLHRDSSEILPSPSEFQPAKPLKKPRKPSIRAKKADVEEVIEVKAVKKAKTTKKSKE